MHVFKLMSEVHNTTVLLFPHLHIKSDTLGEVVLKKEQRYIYTICVAQENCN